MKFRLYFETFDRNLPSTLGWDSRTHQSFRTLRGVRKGGWYESDPWLRGKCPNFQFHVINIFNNQNISVTAIPFYQRRQFRPKVLGKRNHDFDDQCCKGFREKDRCFNSTDFASENLKLVFELTWYVFKIRPSQRETVFSA